MRRLLVIAALLATGAASFLSVGAGEEPGYRVRAIFDNAGFIVKGEDVKVAGVKVGSIDSLDVTPDNRAAVVLDITDPAYQDFRSDASCTIRPQSLIGEEFVECSPTRRHPPGTPLPPPLREVDGARLLPVENTTASVDLDLVASTLQLPQRQRLSIIVNELGAGLAGRGRDLNEVIRRANPALREIQAVLRLLARQNDTLERLAVDSDRIMAPLAREREHVGSFIEDAGEVAEATAERREELAAGLERLPGFVDELTPAMARLEHLADEMTPVVSDLGDTAPQLDRVLARLGPFSRAGTTAVKALGAAAEPGIPAIEAALPIAGDLRTLGKDLRPVADDLANVLDSFQRNEGIERLMDYMFFQATSVNGFDTAGHFLRAALIVNVCSEYTITPVAGCSANFAHDAPPTGRASLANMPMDQVLARTRAILSGADPAGVIGDDAPARARRSSRRVSRKTPEVAPERAEEPAPAATPEPQPAPRPTQQLLDYLLGTDG